MISNSSTPCVFRPLLLAAGLLTSGITLVFSQTTAPLAPSASDLAKYDKNKNGRLEPDEIAAMEKNEARLASASAPRQNGSPGDASENPVEVLSPFVVNSSTDNGYQASSTLAGTRLNTPLADLGAAISVYTKAFLNDIGATDSQFLIYTTGMEAAGASGNFSGAATDINTTEVVGFGPRADPQSSSRARGLSAPGFTRNFFTSNVAMDSYNTERVTVARGPNSMLFGVGSPAGVVDTSLLAPDLIRNKNSVSVRYGNNDAVRASADLNRVLIPKKLGFRLAGLEDREEFNQRPAFEEKKRIYGALTFEPFRSTSIRANFESGRTRANRPATVLPLDNISPYWFAAGRPSYDWSLYDDPARNPAATAQVASSAAAAFGPGFLMGSTGAIGDQIAIFYTNPADQQPSYGFRTTLNNTTGTNANFVKNQLFQPLVNRDMGQDTIRFWGTFDVFELSPAFWTGANVKPGQQPNFVPVGIKKQGFTDFSAFDFKDHMLDETSRQSESFHTFDIALEQRFWGDRIGVEAAYDRQRVDRRTYISFVAIGGDSVIRIDPNVTLPTGQPNPNLGRPYVASGNTRYTNIFTDRENKRITGYVKYDFKELHQNWGKWLGRHTLGGVREEGLVDTISYNPQFRFDGPLARELNPAVNASNRVPAIVVYIGPSLIGNNNPLQLQPIKIPQIKNGPTIPITSFFRAPDDVDPGHFDTSPASLTTFLNAGTVSREVVKSKAATLQSYWLKEYLITTLGWRRDEDYFVRRAVNFVANPADPNDPGKTAFGFKDLQFPHTPPLQTAREIKSYSAVLRWPKPLIKLPSGTDFSIFYNNSDNFTPSGDRVNPYGQKIDPPQGSTKEYGFNLSTLRDKMVFRVNWFETSVQRQSFIPGVFGTANVPAVVGLVANWSTEGNVNPQLVASRNADIKTLMSALPSNYLDLYGFKVTGSLPNLATSNNTNLPGQSDTTDFTAKGTEFEVVLNATSNWRLTANVAKQQTVQTNELPWLKSFIALMTPIWKQLGDRPVAHYPTGWQPGDSLGGLQTVSSYIDQNIMIPFATAIATEGSASPEQRKWRANLVTNYTFGRGAPFAEKLKGWGIGGAVRWQDKLGIGYPTSRNVDGSANIDIKHPYYAPPLTNVDGWVTYSTRIWRDRIRWSARLSMNNLIGSSDTIPIGVQPWGEISTARLAPERRWYLSNTFDF